MKHLCCIALLFVAVTLGWADSIPSGLPTLQLVPSVNNFNRGDVVTLELNILGLGSPGSMEVGSFDSFIGFDPSLLSPTGAQFTLLLGDPSLGQALTAYSTGPNWAEATDVSLLSVAELDALQPSNFTLATYSFVALQSGSVDFVYLGGPVDNGYGELIAGSKGFTPEPTSILLMLSGVVAGSWWRFRRRGFSNVEMLTVIVSLGFALAQPSLARAQNCGTDKSKKDSKSDVIKCKNGETCKTTAGSRKCVEKAVAMPMTIPRPVAGEEGSPFPPVFSPFPFGKPVTERLPRDPNSILVLPTARVNSDSSVQYGHNEVSIAVNPQQNDNYIYGANDYSGVILPGGDSACGAYYSSDSAQTWTAQGGGTTLPTQPGYGGAGDPAVAFDNANNAYFSCMNFNRSNNNSAMYVFRSLDQGATYPMKSLVVSGVGSNDFVDKEYITTDKSTGKVWLTWTHFGTGVADIMIAGSTTSGATWTAPIPTRVNGLADRNSTFSEPAAGEGSGNDVYVAWQDFNKPSIMISKSVAGGAFGADVVVATITLFPVVGGRPSLLGDYGYFRVTSAPSIDVCRNPSSPLYGQVYVVWADNRNGNGDIWFSSSTTGGSTWSAPKRVNDDLTGLQNDQFFPWLSVDPQCKINIAWYDRRPDPITNPTNKGFHVFMSDSTNGGTTFGPNVRVTTAASKNIQFGGAFIGDYIGLTSTDNQNGHYHHQLQRAVPAWMDITLDSQLASPYATQDVAAATALEAGSWANLDLVLSPNASQCADNIEIVFAGDLTGQFNTFYQGGSPFWNTVNATFNSVTNMTTLEFSAPVNPSCVQPGGSAHVGFNIPGNPGADRLQWTHGGIVVGEPPVGPVDFRYNMDEGRFNAIFCAPPHAAFPLQISQLQLAAAEVPVQLDELNPRDLPGALERQGARLIPLEPPPPLAPGQCAAVPSPIDVPKYKAMILVASEKFVGDPSGNLDMFFVQAIAGAEVRQLCDVNGDHQVDINDIRVIMSKLHTPAEPLGDPADADHDGTITANDARICALHCTKEHCAP
jgi:hypothetical protein